MTDNARFSPRLPVSSLWESIARPNETVAGVFHGQAVSVPLADLAGGSLLQGKLESLRGRNVLLATKNQLPTAVALAELDGVARRLVLCTPDLTAEQLAGVAATAQADVALVDGAAAPLAPTISQYMAAQRPQPESLQRRRSEATEWILLTSGTTGMPKLVMHSFESLAGALPRQPASGKPMVWSTFYDIRRYGGLQIYLRAVLSGSPLVLSSAGESTHDFLTRAGTRGVTHISGTPSHWRKALMSGETALINPEYVRLSGEVADQTVLDNLRAAFPNARVAHAFASTEAGVAFDVNDGLAGFPAEFVGNANAPIQMKIQDGTLWIRSGRTAARYLGNAAAALSSDDGFVDTGDMVELVAGRYHFRGRKGGVINVGGLKVYPEEVESVLNADPRVRMSLVKARRNPITGAVIVAEVVLSDGQNPADAEGAERVKNELLNVCRRTLAAHKVPALLRFVPALELTAAGKLVRPGA
jgi:acyl-coenzyme A synthetase/AMP-(fatty) acid ligase